MLATEEMVGKSGIGGLSAREIAKTANLRNNSSVQYHFGNMDGLLQSIVQLRMGQLDELRSDIILSSPTPLNECNLYTLLKYYAIPNLTLARKEGKGATYPAFMCEYIPYKYPLSGDVLFMAPHFAAPPTTYPALNQLMEQILARLSHLPVELVLRRFTNATLLFFHVLRSMSVEDFQDHHMLETSRVTSDTLLQCIGVLTASLYPPE
ncbi:TetR/AcrR family transcriptional regulator [Caenibius tardaugens]|nr:TetR/AcrR family transcriptional regulator [Caenibius tardaugens]